MEDTFDLDRHTNFSFITAEYVLSQVDDLLIFRHYLGNFSLGKKMKSPFHRDREPSFMITFNTAWLKLMWKEFGKGADSGDCFKLVAKLNGLSYVDAIHKVAMDFGLIKGAPIISKKQIEEARAFKEEFHKREYLIQVAIRPMSGPELKYWEQFGITPEDLKNNHIYGIENIWVNKKFMSLSNTLHYAYYFPKVDKWKIYSPLVKDWKWFGNVSTFEMEDVDKCDLYDKSKPLIITKSRKDRIVLQKIYSNVVSSQNESESAIPKEMDAKFDSFSSKFCWFDTDEAGKIANRKLNYRGYKWINIPNGLYESVGIKDPSDAIKVLGKERGEEVIIKELQKKGII